jgi:hypothetical protein
MAATAQRDPYEALIRKIGYSVGLEHLLRNVKLLVELYVRERDLTYISWEQLIKGEIGRKDRAVVEIGNVFGALNLLSVVGKQIYPQYALEVLALLRRKFESDDARFDLATKVVLSQQILEADGEVFLNCLAGEFVAEPVRDRLIETLEFKRGRLLSAFRNPSLQAKIADIVSIRSEGISDNKRRKSNSPFAGRSEPLDARVRTDSLEVQVAKTASVPDSYLDKALPTRKGWAQDLGYFAGGNITSTGQRLLHALKMTGIGKETEAGLYFWPYERELVGLRLSFDALGKTPRDAWELLIAIADGAFQVSAAKRSSREQADFCLALLREFHELYKVASASRGSIRHQLPLYVAHPAFVAYHVACCLEMPDLPGVLADEFRGVRRLVSLAQVRGTEGALVFRSTE